MASAGIVKTSEFEMEYFSFGRGDKKLVILPGLTIKSIIGVKEAVEEGNSLMMDDFTTYVFDRRKNIPEDYSIFDMGKDTAEAMKELGLEDVYIFGASQGGMIAMAIAVRYPGLVKKLVLGSTSPHVQPGQRAVIDKWIELAEKKDRQELYQEYGKEIYPPDVYEKYKGYFADEAETVTDEDLERFTILAKSILDFNITDELDKIKCPVLALGVFEDTVLDSDATMEIAENLDHRADFALYMYTGFGHAAFDTAPDYRKRIYDFFMKE
ncbi:MAG: alpha/beta hydrolase [Lachnospiraceae bacterium]|nr:alpha/beta hydrolase [Lachnospiraceae bacterium]